MIAITHWRAHACTQNPDLPWKTIVGMALDAAAGILHLHAEHIVHRVRTEVFVTALRHSGSIFGLTSSPVRVVSCAVSCAASPQDLALRNMLVGRDWRVRMADFGLARMMPKDTYAKTRGNIGAVRWLAPEVITKSVYSEKSDSYAFGIGTPYAHSRRTRIQCALC
jgi:serine/threonine protein kinase